METLFPFLVTAQELFNQYGLQHVRYIKHFWKAENTVQRGLQCLQAQKKGNSRESFDLKRHSCGSPVPLFTWPQPCDFFLFPKLKNVLKGRHSRTLENIQNSVKDMLKTIPAEDFQRCYQKWEQHHRCVAAQGNCFEEDDIDFWKKIKTLVNKKSLFTNLFIFLAPL